MAKASGLAADTIILDLEDAVAPDQKARARQSVLAMLRSGQFIGTEVVVRVNGLATQEIAADVAVAVHADAVLVPKIDSALDIARCEAALDASAPDRRVGLWAMIETPRAVLSIAEICAEAERPAARLSCLVVGTNDLAKDARVAIIPGRAPLLSWMSQCVLAARAYGLVVLDGVFNDVRDADGFAAECRQGRELGFDGKTLIHPAQIGPANALYGPSEAEIAAARAVVEAFARPENAGKGVIVVDGRMTERLHLVMAQRVLAGASAYGAR